ncbi:MAG: hypothetical protein H0T89_03785 [Deltaproteobacteria bacterium]|nr:hypothetical protein [Deltaproteobacteria bacterium]MDQ3300460.1 hypothetical protein [Myxococcota bacterium]
MTLRTALLALAFVLLAAAPADAKRRRSFGGGGGSSFNSNGTFGLGIELGGPTGLNGKYFLTPSTALNFGVGYDNERYYGYRYRRNGLNLYIDHLWHPFVLAEGGAVQIPFYVGVGVRFWSFNDRDDFDGTAIGVRAPLGIAFDFNNIPLDIFLQLTFVLDFYTDDYRDDTIGLHLEGSIGARFWFN